MKYLILLLLLIALTACSTKECDTNNDCVPNECCHASTCTSIDAAPDCDLIFCSQECVPNTLDCNQGSCQCVKGKCSIALQ